jgi:hypothetical protein
MIGLDMSSYNVKHLLEEHTYVHAYVFDKRIAIPGHVHMHIPYLHIYIYHSLEISETTKMSSMYYESIINVFTVYAPWISEKKLLAGCDRRGIRMIRPFDSSFLFVSEGWAEFGLLCRDFKTKEYCHLLTPQLWSPFVCEQSVWAIYVPSSH